MIPENSKLLLEPVAIKLLQKYNIPYPEYSVATSPDQAVRIADCLGYPVVLKVVSADVIHKSDLGGVRVQLENGQVADAYQTIIESVSSAVQDAKIDGILVCKQAKPALELIVGAIKDTTFGMTIMFGVGGIWSEIIQDTSFRLAPLERRDAEAMIKEIKGYPLLNGYRGTKPCDINALAELLMSVSRLVTGEPNISELDLNPVRIYEEGLIALDARIFLSKECKGAVITV